MIVKQLVLKYGAKGHVIRKKDLETIIVTHPSFLHLLEYQRLLH